MRNQLSGESSEQVVLAVLGEDINLNRARNPSFAVNAEEGKRLAGELARLRGMAAWHAGWAQREGSDGPSIQRLLVPGHPPRNGRTLSAPRF